VVVLALGSLAATLAAGWSPRLGLDLAGGLEVVFQPTHQASQSDLAETVSILQNRVNGLGVSGAEVTTQGNQQIVVSVPGIKNAHQVLSSIGSTATLLFRPGLCYAPPYSAGQPPSGALPTCGQPYQLVTSNLSGSPSGTNGVFYNLQPDPSFTHYPSNGSDNDPAGQTVLLPGLGGNKQDRYVLGPAELTGHAVKSAYAAQNQLGQWVVNMSLTSEGSKGWDAMTEKYFHEIIGIELDGVVQSAPITQPNQQAWSSFGGQVEISGSFTQQQAQDLAVALNYGALPVHLKALTTETVSPTLGKASLKAGLAAGLAGLILVLLYVIAYYRLLGLVVVVGLGLTAALLWAIISALGHTSAAPTFTLAGVTGLIVSIGITVDSYIVYFERLKDETRAGRTVRTSVDRGFASAWRTVLAADLVSLAAAVVLYLIAIGDVRGFAFFLGLSTLLDVFVTWFFTRPAVTLLAWNERATEARTFGVARGLAMPSGAAA
jgi:preprotein translocase subunit SecD